MKRVIYSNIVINKLQILSEYLTNAFGEKTEKRVLADILKQLDNLGFVSFGTSIKEQYGVDCDYYYIYIDKNYFIFVSDEEKVQIIEMFNEKEDFIYVMFGLSMRSQKSVDYWGE